METHCDVCRFLDQCRNFGLEPDKLKRFRIAEVLRQKKHLDESFVKKMRNRYRISPPDETAMMEFNGSCPAVLDAI